MKKIELVILFVFMSSLTTTKAQDGIEALLASGVDDANRFANAFTKPVSDALIYSLANGWYNTAQAKKFGRFEISFIGGVSQIGSNSTSFTLNENDYNFLRFQSGASTQQVGTIFGQNDPGVFMNIIEDGEIEGTIELPQGLGSSNLEYLPNIMLQGSIGLPLNTELKVRYLPQIETNDVDVQFYGLGLQHEFSEWIPVLKESPLALSGFVGFNRLSGEFRVSGESDIVSSSNQALTLDVDSWHYAALVSTKYKIFNFYGSLGAVSGSADTRLLGEYEVDNGSSDVEGSTLVDPLHLSTTVDGFRATIGAKLSLAFFRLNIDYSIQEFNTLMVGVNLGI